jgi:lipopolysaccharide/colanic/teichoic acid biosynthesis glycosyltransferase
MDTDDKVDAIIGKVNELDGRVDGLEKHDKKSWVFSRSILKRGVGIVWNVIFLILFIALIAAAIFGVIQLMQRI